MTNAIIYGLLSSFALVVGAVLGIFIMIPKRIVALIMAFGSGVLISSLSIDLMTEAYQISKVNTFLGLGFMAGALIFVLGDTMVDKLGAKNRKAAHLKNEQSNEINTTGTAILLGTLLDGIPESLVMGATLASGSSIGLTFVIAVFLSNLPEGIAGTIAMKNSGISHKKIIVIWLSMMMLSTLFTLMGYEFLGKASLHFRAVAMAFASGAIIAMLSDCMLPEAFKEGGKFTGIMVALGFLTAFIISNF